MGGGDVDAEVGASFGGSSNEIKQRKGVLA